MPFTHSHASLYIQASQSAEVAGASPSGSPGTFVARANAHISAYTAGCPARSIQLPPAGGGNGGFANGGSRQKFVMSWSLAAGGGVIQAPHA
jgi:hypothetical protein